MISDNENYGGMGGHDGEGSHNPWDVNVEELYPSPNFSAQLKDELIKVLEMNANDEADRILRNFSASFSNLTQEDIEELILKYGLNTYCLNFADLPQMCIDEDEVYALEMKSLQIEITLKRSKGGKMMELFMKHHQVITQNIGRDQVNEPDKPTWYKKLFGFK